MKCNTPKLSTKQLEAIDSECKRQFNLLLSKYNREAAIQVLYILRFEFGFGQSRLKKFAEKFSEMQKEISDRYYANDSEVQSICEIQLRDSGIDINNLLN